MAEYISKQDVIDYLNGYLHSLGEVGADTMLFDRGQRRALVNTMQDIKAVPAADVQPVKHGRWIKGNREVGGCFKLYPSYIHCSECGNEHYYCTGAMPKYCDECGARMDGDTE